jgi:hypothetical protein
MTPMRIRAGILEHPSVELLRFVDLVGRSVWVYGQKRDLVAARREVNRSSTAPTRSISTTSRPTGRM